MIAQPVYAALLYAEGRVPEDAMAGCQVIFATLADATNPDAAAAGGGGGEIAEGCPSDANTAAGAGAGEVAACCGDRMELVPATSEQLSAAGRAPRLPRESAVIAQLLSPAAMREFRWRRPPGVVVFGHVGDHDDAVLDACEAAGLPVSPCMVGAHEEELETQLRVFLRSFKFPAAKAFVLADWGFLCCADGLDEAAAVFDATVGAHMLAGAAGGAAAASAAAAAAAAAAAGGTGAAGAGVAAQGGSAAAAAAAAAAPPALASGDSGSGPGALAGALSRLGSLLLRSHNDSQQQPQLGNSAAGGGGNASGLPSEPASPMVGALQAARTAFQQGGIGGVGGVSSGAAAAGSLGPQPPVSGTASAGATTGAMLSTATSGDVGGLSALAPAILLPAAMVASGGGGGGGGGSCGASASVDGLTEEMRAALMARPGGAPLGDKLSHGVPVLHAGLKPW